MKKCVCKLAVTLSVFILFCFLSNSCIMCKFTVIQTECFRITIPAYYQSPGLELYEKTWGLGSSIHGQLTFKKASGVTVTVSGLSAWTKMTWRTEKKDKTDERTKSMILYFHVYFQLIHLLFARAQLTRQRRTNNLTALHQQGITLDIGC